jgi:hypothetical protein
MGRPPDYTKFKSSVCKGPLDYCLTDFQLDGTNVGSRQKILNGSLSDFFAGWIPDLRNRAAVALARLNRSVCFPKGE